VANDGGASVSHDTGKSWTTENNQPTAQFYHVAADNAVPYRVYGAQQDNSTVAIASRGGAADVPVPNLFFGSDTSAVVGPTVELPLRGVDGGKLLEIEAERR